MSNRLQFGASARVWLHGLGGPERLRVRLEVVAQDSLRARVDRARAERTDPVCAHGSPGVNRARTSSLRRWPPASGRSEVLNRPTRNEARKRCPVQRRGARVSSDIENQPPDDIQN